MFQQKNKTSMASTSSNGNGTTLVGVGTTFKGDINSNADLRIDGTIVGNITSAGKIIIGATGVIEGDLKGLHADIAGKVTGNIHAKDLLQLKSDSVITGNIYAGKLHVEPSAVFNGQCHMEGAAVAGKTESKEKVVNHLNLATTE